MLHREAAVRRRTRLTVAGILAGAFAFISGYSGGRWLGGSLQDSHPLPAGGVVVTVSRWALENPDTARVVAPLLARAGTIVVVR